MSGFDGVVLQHLLRRTRLQSADDAAERIVAPRARARCRQLRTGPIGLCNPQSPILGSAGRRSLPLRLARRGERMQGDGIVGPITQCLLIVEHCQVLERRRLHDRESRIEDRLPQLRGEHAEVRATLPQGGAGRLRDVHSNHAVRTQKHTLLPSGFAGEADHPSHVSHQCSEAIGVPLKLEDLAIRLQRSAQLLLVRFRCSTVDVLGSDALDTLHALPNPPDLHDQNLLPKAEVLGLLLLKGFLAAGDDAVVGWAHPQIAVQARDVGQTLDCTVREPVHLKEGIATELRSSLYKLQLGAY